jgi:hypothetical protein
MATQRGAGRTGGRPVGESCPVRRYRASSRMASRRGTNMHAWSHADSYRLEWSAIACPGWTIVALRRSDPQGTGVKGSSDRSGYSDSPGCGIDSLSLRSARPTEWHRRRCDRRSAAGERSSAQAHALFCWCQFDAAKTLAKTTPGRYRPTLESGGSGWAAFGG